eukprot:4384212-Prymnesium_polylepis.1
MSFVSNMSRGGGSHRIEYCHPPPATSPRFVRAEQYEQNCLIGPCCLTCCFAPSGTCCPSGLVVPRRAELCPSGR